VTHNQPGSDLLKVYEPPLAPPQQEVYIFYGGLCAVAVPLLAFGVWAWRLAPRREHDFIGFMKFVTLGFPVLASYGQIGLVSEKRGEPES
jgi:hypothetical protein